MRPLANKAARSWKMRTACASESDNRSNRANGDGGAPGCGTGCGIATDWGAGGGTGCGLTVRRRDPLDGAAGGGDFLLVTRETNCFALANSPGSARGFLIPKYQ